MEIAFWHTGVFESFGCFFAVLVVLCQNGFFPGLLFGLRAEWDSKAINDLKDSYGQEWVSLALNFNNEPHYFDYSFSPDLWCSKRIRENLLRSLRKCTKIFYFFDFQWLNFPSNFIATVRKCRYSTMEFSIDEENKESFNFSTWICVRILYLNSSL